MSKPEFVHLHAHTEYSLLDGTVRFVDDKDHPSDFLKWIQGQGMNAMAMTDHGNLYGAIEFYKACTELKLKPIVGIEAYMAPGSRKDKSAKSEKDATRHLILLAKDEQGYKNLMALSSEAFLDGYHYKPRIDKEILRKYSKGLIGLSGCLKSEISQALTAGNQKEADRLVGEYVDILGKENFFIELMDHGLPMQTAILEPLQDLAKRMGLPVVATNDCHYWKKDDWEAHDARVCISTGALMEETKRLRFETHEFYYKNAEEMHKLFGHVPGALSNTLAIAERCDLKLKFDQILLPHFPVPEGETVDTYVEKLCFEGLKMRRGKIEPEYEKRLKYELGVIKTMGFSSYFLIVWDFIRHARSLGIPVGPGRGSGAGSAVAWTLDITRVDPLQHSLLFERFLNPDRISMPDLDIDFSDDGRDKVIDYVKHKYGEANVAQIITFASMNARAVVRDVGRVMNLPIQEIDKLAKLIPGGPGSTIAKGEEASPELKDAQKDPKVKKLMDLAKKLEGVKRHTGVHAAGTIIAKEAVVNYSPLARGSNEVVTTQYNDVSVLGLGLLKVDFLGLRTLKVIHQAAALVRRKEPGFDIEKLPFDDAKTFELLRSGHTLGVFQVDSDGMRDLMRRLKPTTFQDISAVIALYRPGPMESGMLDDFVKRKHGAQVRYDHPILKEILNDTYGCMVYQEQIMEISKKMAGFTPGQADGLRKAMGKKNMEMLEKQRGNFVKGAKEHGVSDKVATKIFDQMLKFGGYGFNKSHTVAYAVVAYQTAYLKANYPLEFMTALLSSEIGHGPIGDSDKESKLIVYDEEAQRMGLKLVPPDVQKSGKMFETLGHNGDGRIVYALLAIKNVGEGAVESIIEARKKGPFVSLDDFCRRVDLRQTNRKVIESLIKAGAMDGLVPGAKPNKARASLLAAVETTLSRLSQVKEDLARGQGFLFGGDDGGHHESALPEVRPLSEHDLLHGEREVLGFYLSGHPLTRYKEELAGVSTHRIGEIQPGTEGTVRLAGLISGVRRLVTREKKEAYARMELEDLTGSINVLVFPKAYAAGLNKLLEPNKMVVVSGRLSSRGDPETAVAELIADDIQPLEQALGKWARSIVISLSTVGMEEGPLLELKRALSHHPGECPVLLKLQTPGHGTAVLATEDKVAISAALFEELEKTLGEKTWRIESAS